MRETGKYLGFWVLACLSVAACGGDDDSNGGVVTGLPAEQKLSTLSDADVKKACQSVNDGASAVFTPAALTRGFCVETAVDATASYSNGEATVDVNQCQKLVDSCVSGAKESEEDDQVYVEVDAENDCNEASANELKGCEATVGEYEACINVVLSEAQRWLAQLTCSNAEKLASEAYSNDAFDPAELPQCQTIMAKCPGTTLGIPFAD